ncbi:MAG: cation transporter, partial [Bacteroidales bacterium]
MSEKHHHPKITVQKAFIIGIVLNILFVIVEFTTGIWSGSVGLISDAGHNLSDVAGLLLAMLAYGLTKIAATKKYTYGFKKTT